MKTRLMPQAIISFLLANRLASPSTPGTPPVTGQSCSGRRRPTTPERSSLDSDEESELLSSGAPGLKEDRKIICQNSLKFVWFKRREKTHQLKVSRWSSIRSCFSESVENSMFLPLNWTGVPENLATCSTSALSHWGGTERRPTAAATITWQQLLLVLLWFIYSDVHSFYGKTGLTGKEKMLECQDATKY